MKLQDILLENFRNHKSTQINCSPGLNFFVGDNGEGKTNILEGISYLCLSKSFYAENDMVVINLGNNCFKSRGNFLSDGEVAYNVQVEFDGEQKQKTVTVNKTEIEKMSLLIGRFPLVILSPEQRSVTLGTPSDRRRFVDFVISQSNRIYLENLIEYRRILRQRNRILSELNSRHSEDHTEIEPWNNSLIKIGSNMMKKRIEFINEFQSEIKDSYSKLAGISEKPGITYKPSFDYANDNAETIISAFTEALNKQFLNEKRIGYSLIGPHRDEFVFHINNLNMRSYASHGQHKTFLVAIKMAEFFYLKNYCNETPIMLLDDVFSELDAYRSKRLVEIMVEFGQVFITSTEIGNLNRKVPGSIIPRKFYIKQGILERIEDATYTN